uniref:Uncharacterized protein n=1 Tax=Rhizophora mucronata TaxID=61149 RepID=A0A2P2NAR5_RHIMU
MLTPPFSFGLSVIRIQVLLHVFVSFSLSVVSLSLLIQVCLIYFVLYRASILQLHFQRESSRLDSLYLN